MEAELGQQLRVGWRTSLTSGGTKENRPEAYLSRILFVRSSKQNRSTCSFVFQQQLKAAHKHAHAHYKSEQRTRNESKEQRKARRVDLEPSCLHFPEIGIKRRFVCLVMWDLSLMIFPSKGLSLRSSITCKITFIRSFKCTNQIPNLFPTFVFTIVPLHFLL